MDWIRKGKSRFKVSLKRCMQQAKPILLSSHQLQEVTDICTQLIILNNGTIRYRSSMEAALATRPHVTIEVDRDLFAIIALCSTYIQTLLLMKKGVLHDDAVPCAAAY